MTKRNLKAELEAMRLPELQAKFAEVTGEETKDRNKKTLVLRIIEAMEGAEAPETPADDAGKKQKAPKKAKAAEAPEETEGVDQGDDDANAGDAEPKLSKLDVPALQAKYLEIIGRETKSTSKSYLVWKIRQAEKGKVPIGPRIRGEGIEHKVLPVRVPASAVADLDECWKRLGIKSRTEFFRRAVHAYLEGAGETDTAALFA